MEKNTQNNDLTMKTNEEKAKAYDEALERARKAYNAIPPESRGARKIIEDAFPELRESEDERIRKKLIQLVNKETGWKQEFPSQGQCLAWLEKQKDCILVPKSHLDPAGKPGVDGMKILEKQKEQKPAEWSEDFDKEVENIHKRYPEVSFAKLTRIAYHFSKWANKRKDIEWGEEDEKIRKLLIWQVHRNIEDDTNDLAQSVYDGIKGHDPDLEESIEDGKKCLAWLKSLRPSWKPSEDEERLINTSISFLKDFADKGYENAVECIDWLKSKLNGNSCK